MGPGRARAGGSRGATGPVGPTVHHLLPQLRPYRLHAAPRVRHGEARPLREVLNRGRPAGREVARGQLDEPVLARKRAGIRSPLIEQRVGELLPASRAAADERLQLGVRQNVRRALAVERADPRPPEDLPQLLASEVPSALEGSSQGGVRLPERPGIELELPIPGGHGRVDSRGREREQPPDVLPGDEMPGGAHDVGAEDGTVGEFLLDGGIGRAAHSEAESPFRARVVLRLGGDEPANHVDRAVERWPFDTLTPQTISSDAHGVRSPVPGAGPARGRVAPPPAAIFDSFLRLRAKASR